MERRLSAGSSRSEVALLPRSVAPPRRPLLALLPRPLCFAEPPRSWVLVLHRSQVRAPGPCPGARVHEWRSSEWHQELMQFRISLDLLVQQLRNTQSELLLCSELLDRLFAEPRSRQIDWLPQPFSEREQLVLGWSERTGLVHPGRRSSSPWSTKVRSIAAAAVLLQRERSTKEVRSIAAAPAVPPMAVQPELERQLAERQLAERQLAEQQLAEQELRTVGGQVPSERHQGLLLPWSEF